MLARNLKVMDGAAIALARDAGIPIIVFSIQEEGSFTRVLSGRSALNHRQRAQALSGGQWWPRVGWMGLQPPIVP